MQAELYRISKNKRSLFFIGFMIAIPLLDFLLSLTQEFQEYLTDPVYYYHYFQTHPFDHQFDIHPAATSFLAGNTIGHLPQMLYIWVLPLLLLAINGDYYLTDMKNGIDSIQLTKLSRKDWLKKRYILTTSLSFIVAFSGLLLNFGLVTLVFHKGYGFQGLELYRNPNPTLLNFSIDHPYSIYFAYILVFSVLTALLSILCLSLSFLFPNPKVVYPACFLIWIIQIIAPNSLTYVMQPFIEYGLDSIIPALLVYTGIVLIVTVTAIIYQRRYHEL